MSKSKGNKKKSTSKKKRKVNKKSNVNKKNQSKKITATKKANSKNKKYNKNKTGNKTNNISKEKIINKNEIINNNIKDDNISDKKDKLIEVFEPEVIKEKIKIDENPQEDLESTLKEKPVLIETVQTREIKKKKYYPIILLIFVIILIASGIIFLNKTSAKAGLFTKIDFDEYMDLYKNEGLSYIYIKNDNCAQCELIEPSLSKLVTEYKIDIKELNESKLNDDEKEKLISSNTVFDDGFVSPTIISIKNGKEILNVKGNKEYSILKRFVEGSKNPDAAMSFINIDINKYLSVIKSNELSVVYIGRKNSNEYKKYAPILEKVSTELKIKVYYLNTDSLESEDDWNKLESSNQIFSGMWFTPATLVIKNGNIVEYKFELLDEDMTREFLRKYGG